MGLRAGVVNLAWRVYYGLGKRVTAWPVWRLRIGSKDLGRLLDAVVRRALPSPSRVETEITLFNGCTMLLPPRYQDVPHYKDGVYQPQTERATTRVFFGSLIRGQVVVDIGAHLGYYTLIASRVVGEGGRVFAFEPDPSFFRYLLDNLRRNECENVVAEQLAISDRFGQALFFSQPESAGSSLYNTGQHRTRRVQVGTVTLDEYFARLDWPHIHLLKMDIEGGEMGALNGMTELVRRNQELKLIFEVELRALAASGHTAEELLLCARNLGFREFYTLGETLEPIRVPEDVPRVVSRARRELCVNVLCQRGQARDVSS